MKYWYILIGFVVAVGGFFLLSDRANTPTETPQQPVQTPTKTKEETPAADRMRIKVSSVDGAASTYRFSAEVPSAWKVEAVTANESLNFYDPAVSNASTLEQSQIFVRFFEANKFITLTTVDVLSRIETTVGGRPAVRYEIAKKASVANFANQPSWRSEQHVVTDVRVSDSNPSIFYVIAKRPDLDQAVYDHFLATFDVSSTSEESRHGGTPSEEIPTSTAAEPVAGFLKRITKKPFGIHITPSASPVQPERFSGYHTGADAEFDDGTQEVEVRSIADGTVEVARTADGYGGVVVIRHEISRATYHVVYGHLDPGDLPTVGATVTKGQRIGQLGAGGTAETDGERKHLHLGVHKGSQPNLKGYVEKESDLTQWLDPVTLYQQD